jgi:hypothetical protein
MRTANTNERPMVFFIPKMAWDSMSNVLWAKPIMRCASLSNMFWVNATSRWFLLRGGLGSMGALDMGSFYRCRQFAPA